MSDRQNSPQQFLLGTAVKFTAILSVDTATVTITIKDCAGIIEVNAASMTKDANKVYSYIWQSSTSDSSGDYISTISITYSGYTSVRQDVFRMVEQE